VSHASPWPLLFQSAWLGLGAPGQLSLLPGVTNKRKGLRSTGYRVSTIIAVHGPPEFKPEPELLESNDYGEQHSQGGTTCPARRRYLCRP
jgi:hypothetical protein